MWLSVGVEVVGRYETPRRLTNRSSTSALATVARRAENPVSPVHCPGAGSPVPCRRKFQDESGTAEAGIFDAHVAPVGRHHRIDEKETEPRPGRLRVTRLAPQEDAILLLVGHARSVVSDANPNGGIPLDADRHAKILGLVVFDGVRQDVSDDLCQQFVAVDSDVLVDISSLTGVCSGRDIWPAPRSHRWSRRGRPGGERAHFFRAGDRRRRRHTRSA